MFLQKLTLFNFKNYREVSFAFSEGFNLITGRNGSGKTNLLDAVHFCGIGKSFLQIPDQQLIRKGADFLRMEASVSDAGTGFELVCRMPAGKRKELFADGQKYKRLSEHIGRLPVIMIAPDDNQLILGHSDERRRYMDLSLGQTSHDYLEKLLAYNKTLAQRNALLKREDFSLNRHKALLETYDESLIRYGMPVHDHRKAFIAQLQPYFERFYRKINDEREELGIRYESELNESSFADILARNLDKDLVLRRTSGGIHRDDLHFSIGEQGIRKFGSQGQQKSLLMALKLSQYEFVLNMKEGRQPLLLLDDIFDKLDEERCGRLIALLNEDLFGQVFITATSFGESHRKLLSKDAAYFVIESGTCL